MTPSPTQCNTLESASNAVVFSDQEMGELFEIVHLRGEKFANHEEDSSVVDSLSDNPAVMELFHFFHSCDEGGK